MQFQFIKILTILLCQIYTSLVHGKFLGMNTCLENQTLSVQILATEGENTTCQCQAGPISDPDLREDYTYFPGLGAYKFHTVAKDWNDARKICNEENAHLAIINSKTEEKVMLDMFKKQSADIHGTGNKNIAFLGLHDMYKEGEWVTIFGESIYSTGYAEWSSTNKCYGAQPDNKGGDQNCAALFMNCGTMDDEHCFKSHAFFCEKPIPCAIQSSFVTISGHSLDRPLAN